MTCLWNLRRAPNNDGPSRSKAVTEANNELITENRVANVFADLYQEQNTICVARERIKQVREETENIILSSYGEERDCSMTGPFSMKELKDALKKVKTRKAPGPDHRRYVETSWSLLQSSTSEDFQPQPDEGGNTCSLERGCYYTSSKER